jgi:uncharacterized GH25 family protein
MARARRKRREQPATIRSINSPRRLSICRSPTKGIGRWWGDRLEIVPVTNPAAAKVGDEITFKVLFEGQPLSTPVFATYDRFSESETTYAYYTETANDGTAKVQITHLGLWMVRVEINVPEKTEDYDSHLARAVLVFRVNNTLATADAKTLCRESRQANH